MWPYSHLGRREEALSSAEEAVPLYRQLAQQRPDAFLPDLAMSLGALGNILQANAPGEAATRFHEGIQLLSPLFLQLPQAHGQLMMALLQVYLLAAEQAGLEIDMALLGPVQERLQAAGLLSKA